MLHIVQSNRLDTLAEPLLASWAAPGADPFAPELVIVPSRGVERWLTHRIADRFGVCANVRFEFAAAFIWQMFSRVLPGVSEQSPFDTDVTALRLFSFLGRLPERPELRPLSRYLAKADDVRRLELAQRIAQLFSQYMVYRPDWLAKWALGVRVGLEPAETERWQQHLWRWLLESLGARNVQHPMTEFFEALDQGSAAATSLPARLRVFGVPVVPPLYAEILARLARHIEVEWYSLNPCRQYWADITQEKERARRIVRGEPGAELRDVGHPLLASCGGQAQTQLALVCGFIGDEGSVDSDCFVEPRGSSLLQKLQSSILDLAEPTAGSLPLERSDRSLQVHACHSLTRQLEVLHDQLLALFDAMPGLRASDVAVFTPDLDAAAPVIDAVFGSMPAARHIPYTVTGRRRPDSAPLLRAADFLLRLPGSRFEANLVLGFLEIPAVGRRYGLEAAELETIQRWLREAGVHWGLDGVHRHKLGLPSQARHTWLETLYKLLLGYAMPGGADRLVFGTLPYGELEGSQALTLGKLVKVLSDLVRTSEAFGARPRIRDWPALLLRHLSASIEPTPEDERDYERLRATIAGLSRDARTAAVEGDVGIDVVRALLEARLAQSAPGAVPSGQVTFAGIGPLRTLPYRVICLVGMDDGAIPRSRGRLEFDLMQGAPRFGDRSRRDDDRGAFLDALLAASDVLYLSYSGRDIRDNAKLQPSVLVAELLDYLGRWAQGGRPAVDQALVTSHPLQAFSPRYFEGGELQSYAADLLPVAQALRGGLGGRLAQRSLLDRTPLPPPDESLRRVELDSLQRFFTHPLCHLLGARLGIRLKEAAEQISADEPFGIDIGGHFDLKDQLLEWRLQGRTVAECMDLAMATPLLPSGAWGRQALEPTLRQIDELAGRVERARSGTPRDPLAFELPLGEFTLAGTLSQLDSDGAFSFSLRKQGVYDLMDAWLRHLVLCCVAPAGVSPRTRTLTSDGGLRFERVNEAPAQLLRLLELYWRGLQAPLSFYPKSAYALLTAADADKGRAAAEKAWQGSGRGTQRKAGERDGRWYRFAFGGAEVELPEDFDEVSHAVLDAPLAARQDLAAPGAEPCA
ncbi:MAG TPA: exodeoxyribonuclease V subunit gamma [Solimonas sp.]|nr:exodeoxyribonuclease V subunit gamma [Solimonas sp.]